MAESTNKEEEEENDNKIGPGAYPVEWKVLTNLGYRSRAVGCEVLYTNRPGRPW